MKDNCLTKQSLRDVYANPRDPIHKSVTWSKVVDSHNMSTLGRIAQSLRLNQLMIRLTQVIECRGRCWFVIHTFFLHAVFSPSRSRNV